MLLGFLKPSSSKRQATTESCCWQSYVLGSNPSDMTVFTQSVLQHSQLAGAGAGVGWGQGTSLRSLRNFFPCNCSSSTCTWGRNRQAPRQGLPLPELTICSQMLVVKTWFFSSLKKQKEKGNINMASVLHFFFWSYDTMIYAQIWLWGSVLHVEIRMHHALPNLCQ